MKFQTDKPQRNPRLIAPLIRFFGRRRDSGAAEVSDRRQRQAFNPCAACPLPTRTTRSCTNHGAVLTVPIHPRPRAREPRPAVTGAPIASPRRRRVRAAPQSAPPRRVGAAPVNPLRDHASPSLRTRPANAAK